MKTIFPYGVVGGCAAIAEWLCFFLCVRVLSWSVTLSAAGAFVLAILVNGLLTRLMARRKDLSRITERRDVLPMLLVAYTGLLVNLLLLCLLADGLHMTLPLAKGLSTAAAFFWCYTARKRWVYGRLARLCGEKRLSEIYAALLSVLTLTLALCAVNDGHSWGGDFSQYIAQGIAIAEGTVERQFADNGWILSHTYVGLGPTAYPWGLPLLLSVLYQLFGFNLYAFKAVGIVSVTLFALGTYVYFHKRFSGKNAFLLAGLFAVNSYIVFRINNISSDGPFFFFSMAALICGENLLKAEDKRGAYLWGALTGVALACGLLLRTSGVVLVIALFCVQALAVLRRCRGLIGRIGSLSGEYVCRFPIAQAIPYVIALAAYAVVNAFLPGGDGSYVAMLSQITPQAVLAMAEQYLFFPFIEKISNIWIRAALYMIVFLGATVAAVAAIRMIKKELLSVVYAFGTILLLLIWHSADTRMMFPVYPLIVCFVARMARDMVKAVGNPKIRRGLARLGKTAVSLVFAGFLVLTGRDCASNLRANRVYDSGAYAATSVDMYDYIIANTAEDAKIVFFKPRVLYLTTGHLGYEQRPYNGDTLADADYLLIQSNDKSFDATLQSVQGTDMGLIEERANKDLTLFRITRGANAQD